MVGRLMDNKLSLMWKDMVIF